MNITYHALHHRKTFDFVNQNFVFPISTRKHKRTFIIDPYFDNLTTLFSMSLTVLLVYGVAVTLAILCPLIKWCLDDLKEAERLEKTL